MRFLGTGVRSLFSLILLLTYYRFRHLSLTQIMRQLRRECDLLKLVSEHFYLDFLGIATLS